MNTSCKVKATLNAANKAPTPSAKASGNVIAFGSENSLFFSLEMVAELRDHLRQCIAPDGISAAVRILDLECHFAARGETAAHRRAELRKMADACIRFSEALEGVRVMAMAPELAPTFGLTLDDFCEFLDVVVRARERAVSLAAKTRKRAAVRGRSRLMWRDNLIHAVYRIYPPGGAVKSEGSHFEQSVSMLLRFLDREVSDVHSAIVDALGREYDPPAF